ncbi:esterase/lipase family protein [Nocardia crassostreae]|uniref:esterase/lipase family protein n=1 Tax=Nocardia crassostreae TaxID=53428 RepID=UPI0008326749|nr:alpha/beta hydrolase [Nocardia crassostreae]
MKLAGLLAALAIAATVGSGAAAAELPVPYGNGEMLRIAATDWNGAVAGANDFGCKPSAANPKPVVLVGSTFLSEAVNWTALAPYLHNRGFCVFTLDYGQTMYPVAPGLNGMDPIPLSASEVGALVDRVLAATGADKVDVVAHSQGGVVARYYANQLGGAAEIDRMVLLSSPYTMTGLPIDVMDVASRVIPRDLYDAILYNGAIQPLGLNLLDPWSITEAQVLQPNIRYTQITDIADEMGLLGGMHAPAGAPNAETRYIDAVCPTDFSQHFAQPYSPTAVAMIANTLDPVHPVTPPCTVVPLYSVAQR